MVEPAVDVDCCFSVLFRDGLRIVIEGECGGGVDIHAYGPRTRWN